jgi:hypothetical protein
MIPKSLPGLDPGDAGFRKTMPSGSTRVIML